MLIERPAPRCAVLLVLALAACGSEASGPPAGPSVTLVDSLVVSDPDTFPRREGARSLVMSGRGDLLVEVEDRILHFDPSGRFVRAIGTPGEGPGELRRVSGLATLPGDSILAVVSHARGRIVVFGMADGAARGEVVVPEIFGAGQHWVRMGDTVIIPSLSGTIPFRRWVIGTDTAHAWGESPPSQRDGASRTYLLGGEVSAAPHGGDLLALVPVDSALLRYDPAGRITGRVPLAVVRRDPIAPDGEAQLREMMARTPPAFALMSPFVLGIHRRPDGSYVLVHFQAETESFDNPVRLEYANVRYWISLLSADLTRQCVDGELPDPPEDVIRPVFRGDTVMLHQRLVTDVGAVRTVLRKYLVRDVGCDWIATPDGGNLSRGDP